MILRIVWATKQRNTKIAISANIFVAAGTVLLFLINLLFAQRIIRAQHPRLGWHKIFGVFYRLLIVIIVLTLIAMIATVVQSFFTLNANTRRIDRDIQLYGLTFYAFVAFLPIPMVLLGLVLPKRIRTEKFGKGRFRTKIIILTVATMVLSLGACWRCGTAWAKPVPRAESPWYFSKPFFYVFNFAVEAMVIMLYAIVRVDRRFHIPNGARGSYIFIAGETEKGVYRAPPAPVEGETLRVYTEDELFDDASTLADTLRFGGTTLELDRMSGKWSLKRQSVSTLYMPYCDMSDTSSLIDTRRPSQVFSTSEYYGSLPPSVHSRTRPASSSPLSQLDSDIPDVPTLPERLASMSPMSVRSSGAVSTNSQASNVRNGFEPQRTVVDRRTSSAPNPEAVLEQRIRLCGSWRDGLCRCRPVSLISVTEQSPELSRDARAMLW